jgi:hypothetical protein
MAALSVTLAIPAAAQATAVTASRGAITATLSYSGGPGITTKNERIIIKHKGRIVFNQGVPSTGCFQVCGPGSKHPVAVAPLHGNAAQDVVLTLWDGGADCCTVAFVYVHSTAVHSFVLDRQSFGVAGFALKDIGRHRRPEFVTADNHFYCQFTDCASSGLPLKIFEFRGERFVDVTKSYPKLIAADAARWLSLYHKNPSRGLGVIAAWAADEDNLGQTATVSTVLQREIAAGHLKQRFVASLERFLATHHYS